MQYKRENKISIQENLILFIKLMTKERAFNY